MGTLLMQMIMAIALIVIVVPVLCKALQMRDGARFGEEKTSKSAAPKGAQPPTEKNTPAHTPEMLMTEAEKRAAEKEFREMNKP